MSEKLTNSNIDDIFRNSIDKMETEPSESFWINASEDALFKSNLLKKRSINRWKVVAAVFGIAVTGLTAYVIYMQKQLNDVKGKLSTVENITNIQPAQVSNHTISVDNVPVVPKQEKTQTEVSGTIAAVKEQEHNNAIVNTNINGNLNATQPLVYRKTKHKKHAHSNAIAAVNSTHLSNNHISIASVTEPSTSNTNEAKMPEGPVSINVNGDNTIPQASSPSIAIADNIVPVQSDIKAVAHKNLLSKLSVSLFYEPYISDELLENEATDIITVNSVSANEEEQHPFTAGLKIDYNILKHLSITTGCLFYSFNVAVSPTTIYAQQQQNGEVGYSFQTSIGTVNCPYVNSAKVGDGMVVSGEERTSYVCIPVQLKYSFVNNSKWGLYVTGGIEANIISVRQMNMQWHDFNWDQGSATEGVDNTKKIYTSYYFAPGIRYNIYKGISIYFEPSLQGSPVFSKGTNTLPYTGIGGGVTYHF